MRLLQTLAKENAQREKREHDNKMCTEYQLAQLRERAAAKQREQEDAVRRRGEIAAAAKAEEDRVKQLKANERARALKQQMLLAEQIDEKRRDKYRDPDSAAMTPLETVWNRALLVSMAQHSDGFRSVA